MAKKSAEILVGDLLVKAGIIDRSDLADALPISLKTGLPVGRILISSGALKESTLQAALFAQSMLRDCLLTEDISVQAIRLLDHEGCSLDDALAKLGWKSDTYELTNRLGQLFLDAQIIDEEELAAGLEGFYAAGLPLARVLVIQGVINNEIAFAALSAQRLVRDSLITREQAIEALKAANANQTSLEESLSVFGYLKLHPDNTIRLGELLVLAGLATEEELLENVERSLNQEEYIGETFVNSGRISQGVLDSALELQRLATAGIMEPRQSAEALRRIAITGMSVNEAVTEATASPEMRAQLLGLQSETSPAAVSHPAPLIEDFEEADGDYEAQYQNEQAHHSSQPTRQHYQQNNRRSASSDQRRYEAPDEDALAPYLMALQKMIKGQLKSRKKARADRQRYSRNYAVDSALLAMTELQSRVPKDSAVLSRQHLKLIDKMMKRIEELSFKAGYLEGCIDSSNLDAEESVLEEICKKPSRTAKLAMPEAECEPSAEQVLTSVTPGEFSEEEESHLVSEPNSSGAATSDSQAHEHASADLSGQSNESAEPADSATSAPPASSAPGQQAPTEQKKTQPDNTKMSKKKRKRMMISAQI